jgi:DNA-binding beta-propeller fold protein YncE
MSHSKSFRVYFLAALLLVLAIVIVLREHRPSFLRPGLHLNAYVSSADGSLVVLDLASLRVINKLYAGPQISDLREHQKRPEIWGVSSAGGFAFVLDTRSNQLEKIPVGPAPLELDFSADGKRGYTTSAVFNQLIAINIASRSIAGRASTAGEPVQARITPDQKTIIVVNRRSSTLTLHDAATLQIRSSIPVIPQPDAVEILPDSSIAFVMSRSQNRLSVVDLLRSVLLTNLELVGRPSQMLLKPDGGELYVLSPEAHVLQAVNTWTHEVGDTLLIGDSPSSAILTDDASEMYVADRTANHIFPVDIINRRIAKPINVGASPGALRFVSSGPTAKPSMLLVSDESSGDLAVLRLRSDTDSLLTLIPLGVQPQRLSVKLFP